MNSFFQCLFVILFLTRTSLAGGFESISRTSPDIGYVPDALPMELQKSRILPWVQRWALDWVREQGRISSAPSCVKAATLTDFIGVAGAPPLETETLASLLGEPAQSIHSLFKILETSPTASRILAKFRPKFGFEVKVSHFSENDRKLASTPNPAALYDPETRTIYIDKTRKNGDVAFVFLHEMVHSMDQDLEKALEKERQLRETFRAEFAQMVGEFPEIRYDYELPKARRDSISKRYAEMLEYRDIRLYRAERFAYDASFAVWKELAKRFPTYYDQHNQPSEHTDDTLIKILRLHPETVRNYSTGRCTVWKK